MKKIKIFLVPHSHWDREWYFTFDTANILLHHNLEEYFHLQGQKWFLDGQWSLLDEAKNWKKEKQKWFKKQLQENNLAIGPLYTQPDVFNSQGETIIRNFEIGSEEAEKWGVKQLKTAYLPDTFGFGENIPQIFKHCQIENFVFWRGLPIEQLAKDDSFIWKGIDNSQLNSYVLRNGYFPLGAPYPYQKTKENLSDQNVFEFINKIDYLISQKNKVHNFYIFPLGGDQAPYLHLQNYFLKKLNSFSNKYTFELRSNFDDFFQNTRSKEIYQGPLITPKSGKIHRTISSSRYDIKKMFRMAEDKLYYLLEPLEIFYQGFSKNYQFEQHKKEHIVKPLLIAQGHDSLGACNTDTTNYNQLHRLKKINDNLDAQVDLLIKKLIKHQKFANESLVIFNPSPFVNDYHHVMTIYSEKIEELNISSPDLVIQTLASEKINWASSKNLYRNKIAISAFNLKPLALNYFPLDNSFEKLKLKQGISPNDDSTFVFTLGKEKIALWFSAIEDQGDSYDFSPGKKIDLEISNLESWTKVAQNHQIIYLAFKINHSQVKLYLFKKDNRLAIEGSINNQFKNTRLSLNIKLLNGGEKIYKSQNLALRPFYQASDNEDWKKQFLEYPASVDHNDGIVALGKKLSILTKGTNEIFKINQGVQITLYRAHQFVSKNNLAWRPTSSGLAWYEEAPAAQLQKQLNFDFVLTTDEPIKALNDYKFKPYAYKIQQGNFIANKMTRFEINPLLETAQEQDVIKIDNPHVFISSLRRKDHQIVIRLVNMIQDQQKIKVTHNNQSQSYILDSYEIKLVTFVKEKNEK